MKKFFKDFNIIEIITVLVFITIFIFSIGVCIYEFATTTYEYVDIEGTVIDKDIKYEHHAIYKTVNNERVLDHYETIKKYYLFCSTDTTDIAKIQVNFIDYHTYQKDYVIPLTKTYRYKKGTDKLKGIDYDLKKN